MRHIKRLALFSCCLLLLACSKGPDSQFSLAKQGLLSGSISSNAQFAAIGSVHHGGSLWDLKNNEDRENIELDWSESENICLYKNESGIKVQFLTPDQIDVLEKIKLGLNLDSALENSEMDPSRVQELFSFISTSGILVDIC